MPGQRRQRTVALVASSYHPHFGGVEEHTRHVARVLRLRGYHVEVWTVDRGEHLGHRAVDGVQVRYLPTPLPARKPVNLLRFVGSAPLAFARWVRAIRRLDPDLLHVHCFGPNGPYAVAAAAVARRPVIISGHGETFMDAHDIFGRSALMNQQLKYALQSSAAVTACSRVAAQDLISRFGATDVVVVPNGTEQARSSDSVARRHTVQGAKQVVAVGRMVEVKGFDLLLHAFATVDPPHRLVLVGEGPERSALEALALELGIGDRVDFPGRLEGSEVLRVMQESNAVVVPSRREAFGIVVLEAWTSGTPLIATSRGGPRDIVTDEVDGLIVDPEDLCALARAICRVFEDEDLADRLASTGRLRVQSYTWEAVVDRYEEIYSNVLGDG